LGAPALGVGDETRPASLAASPQSRTGCGCLTLSRRGKGSPRGGGEGGARPLSPPFPELWQRRYGDVRGSVGRQSRVTELPCVSWAGGGTADWRGTSAGPGLREKSAGAGRARQVAGIGGTTVGTTGQPRRQPGRGPVSKRGWADTCRLRRRGARGAAGTSGPHAGRRAGRAGSSPPVVWPKTRFGRRRTIVRTIERSTISDGSSNRLARRSADSQAVGAPRTGFWGKAGRLFVFFFGATGGERMFGDRSNRHETSAVRGPEPLPPDPRRLNALRPGPTTTSSEGNADKNRGRPSRWHSARGPTGCPRTETKPRGSGSQGRRFEAGPE